MSALSQNGKVLVTISIIALLVVIVALTALPIGQAENASFNSGGVATTGSCGAGSAVTLVGNTTIGCNAFLTTQTSAFFSYGSCPANQFATAITTTTLNCATALTTQTSAYFSYGSCPALKNEFVTAVTTTTLSCGASLGIETFQNNTIYTMSTLTGAYNQFGAEFYFLTNTTKILVMWTMVQGTNKTGCGTRWQIDYGTGTAPRQGVSQTGTLVGNPITFFFSFAGLGVAQNNIQLITGLTAGTQYWIDVAVTSAPFNGCGGGNAQYDDINAIIAQV